MLFYFKDEGHTLASVLRCALEANVKDDLVSCTVMHPLDTHIEVRVPSEAVLRRSLLDIKDAIVRVRAEVESQQGHPPPPTCRTRSPQ